MISDTQDSKMVESEIRYGLLMFIVGYCRHILSVSVFISARKKEETDSEGGRWAKAQIALKTASKSFKTTTVAKGAASSFDEF